MRGYVMVPRERWILVVTILGSGMAFIDSTAVGTALPVMQAALHADLAQMQWVVEAYLLFLSALLLVGGALGDRFGRRLVYLVGVVLFGLASVACGLAPDADALVVARAVQGIGGALLVPGSLAILSAGTEESRRGRAIGTWSGFSAITSSAGQVLGGVFAQYASWRWIFFINVPVAIAVLLLALRQVPESRNPDARGAVDVVGAVLATGGLGALVFGLIRAGGEQGFDPLARGTLAGGALALVGFLLAQVRVRSPMVPLEIFRSRAFSAANALTLLLYGALGAVFFFLPFELIQIEGYAPAAAGLVMLPPVVLMSSLSGWAGGLVQRHGARGPLVIGPAIAAIGFALFARAGGGGSYWTVFFPALVIFGFGMTVTVAPLTTTVMGALPEERSGLASGVNNAVARVAGLLAIAALGLLLRGSFDRALDARLDILALSAPVRQELASNRVRLAAMPMPQALAGPQREAVTGAIRASFVTGFRIVCLANAALALGAALLALLIPARRHDDPTP